MNFARRLAATRIGRFVVVPVLVVTATQILRSYLAPVIGPLTTPVQMFSFLAVFVAARTGGLWAGVIATPLSVLAGYLGVAVATGEPPVLVPADYARIALFVGVSAIFVGVMESNRRAERRLARQRDELAEAENELKNFGFLVQNASDFIGICDLAFVPSFVNKAGRRLLGLPEDGPLGVGTIFDFFFPEDHAFLGGEFFERVMRDGHAAAEVRFRHVTTGEAIWMLYGVVRMQDADGRPLGYSTISTDLTERKRADGLIAEGRERLHAALDASVTGTFRWDIVSNALDWDDNLDRLFGLAPGASARSLPEFIRLVHPDDRQRVIDACQRCADGGSDFDEEFRVVWPDGSVRWLYDKGRVYTGRDGRTRYMAGACVDVTERRQKEDALRAADRQKDEFLGMLSHEIRNPIAPMMYSVAVLERRLTDPSMRRPLDVIGRQVRRMLRIVDDLLDVSRVTQGKISLQRERVRIAELVQQAVEANRLIVDARHQTLRIEPIDSSLVVAGDAVRLGQILENLLTNAIKYTPEGGALAVSVVRDRAEVVLTVSDNGVGIAADMLPRVFDLFAQADTSLDRAEGGLGIGLTLVDRLTRLHGGRVEARSAGLGHGSTFVVRLPLFAGEEAAGSHAAPAAGAVIPRRVLIVDDNVDSAETLRALLEMSGHEVHLAHDGRGAPAAVVRFAPDIVLLDVGLPGMDGIQVVRQLRAMPGLASLAIVATTGYGRVQDRQRCLAAGFSAHLTKPVDIVELEAFMADLPDTRHPAAEASGH